MRNGIFILIMGFRRQTSEQIFKISSISRFLPLFTVFRLKNNEKFQQANGQLYAYVTNESCTLILLVIEECLFV